MRFILAMAIVCVLGAVPAFGQDTPEVTSKQGRKFFAQRDEKDEISEAQKKLAADPMNVDLIIALGVAQAKFWRYRDAINTYSRGIEIAPANALLYRHRGHRFISTRQFDKAVADLEKAASINDKSWEIWYHLGLGYYLQGKFDKAADAYEKCRAAAQGDEPLVGLSHWLYISYSRTGKKAEAKQVLERITPGMNIRDNRPYFQLLLLYKGLAAEAEVFNEQVLSDSEIATVGYGVGMWHLNNGNKAKAKEYFGKIVAGNYWPAFGFIASEVELSR
jgi:tetratricopeptide (TPR) repeat protein